MELNIENKKVLITASSDGIGLAIAEAFLREGAYVAINGRNGEKLDRICVGLKRKYGQERVLSIVGDATQTECIKALFNTIQLQWGGLDVLVCNVGSGKSLCDNKYDIEEWKRLYDINLFSSVKLIDQFRWMLEKEDDTSIIMLSSLASLDKISAPPAYAASKAGVNILVKHLADDMADKHVRVNGVAPGNIFYEGGRWEELLREDQENVELYIRDSVPMRRFGTPEEIADAVIFLASERASFITGTVIRVDGGQSRGC